MPAQFGESFGFYVIEALAAGVPVVQPHCASFPELVETTGGGRVYDHEGPESLAAAPEGMLHNPTEAKAIGLKARGGARNIFREHMAEQMIDLLDSLVSNPSPIPEA